MHYTPQHLPLPIHQPNLSWRICHHTKVASSAWKQPRDKTKLQLQLYDIKNSMSIKIYKKKILSTYTNCAKQTWMQGGNPLQLSVGDRMRRGNVVCKRAKKFAGIGASNEWLLKCSNPHTRGQKTKKNCRKQTWMQLSVGDSRRGIIVCKRANKLQRPTGPRWMASTEVNSNATRSTCKKAKKLHATGPGWMAFTPNTINVTQNKYYNYYK